MTIKFLVNLLNIEKKKDGTRMISEVMNETVIEHIVSGVDAISGKRGRQYWQVQSKRFYNALYFTKNQFGKLIMNLKLERMNHLCRTHTTIDKSIRRSNVYV